MNALSYLTWLEFDISKEDSEYAQNVAEFIRRIRFKIYKDSIIEEAKLPKLKALLIKYGVYGELSSRKITRIANWINSSQYKLEK